MTETLDPTQSQLAAPGAGLPKIELQVARAMFWWARKTRDRTRAAQIMNRERGTILKLANTRSSEDWKRRVLIKRLPGMEDSSRFWSFYMTLDHLRIVNEAVALTMRDLSAGKALEGQASTAAVKPSLEAGEAVVNAFDQSCAAVLAAGKSLKETAARFRHPWFGPLDGEAWFVMAGFHMQLHEGQIQRIVSGLDE